ncbi:uncharacterized protein LOC110984432 [Acanthaster planci]|uniref:Uncharacterized protein LOC110984432 n=1 Tax=Acanthaster planci TaxID=133434 RepID=A0A8B7Z5U5_ACAPL|nr:uncharacterized protein LOC110984432 [Acanthaster planci]
MIIVKMESVGEGLLCILACSLLIRLVCTTGDVPSCPHWWCGIIDAALVGFTHILHLTESQGACHGVCKSTPWCGSVNYFMDTGHCQLNLNASHYQAPDRLVRRPGWFYSYVEAEPTDASPGCFNSQKHDPLCVKDSIEFSAFLRTKEKYPSADLSLARDACAQYGMQLCTLTQLKAAYEAGFRSNLWSLINTEGRDAKLSVCDTNHRRQSECAFMMEGTNNDGLIPNTPRPADFINAFCCSSSSCPPPHALQWQLVFMGQAGGQDLYEMWTNPHWESTLDVHGNFRDQAIYDAWKYCSSHIKFVKLSLYSTDGVQPLAKLIFRGNQLNITDWFRRDELLSSPWWQHLELKDGKFPIGDTLFWPRQFVISDFPGNCSLTANVGWLFVTAQREACASINPFAILYSTTHDAVPLIASDARVGMADYMTIHVVKE